MNGLLIFTFSIGMIWDAVTSFLGILEILGGQVGGQNWANYGIAIAGTAIVLGFNISTSSIWRERTWVLLGPWVACIPFDFATSLVGNYNYVIPEAVNPIWTWVIIIFVTFLGTISPMLIGYLTDSEASQNLRD